jgi:Flp pilus assembly protein TadG
MMRIKAPPCRPNAICALARDRSGVAAIEFALVIGLIIMGIVATVQFGRALAAHNEVSHALGRVVRVVNLNAATKPEVITDLLEQYLDSHDGRELVVGVTDIAGTNFMEISVEFPFTVSIPLMEDTVVTLRVATRAPMVSPTQ